MSRDWPTLIAGIAIGASAGAALGILFAPQSGEDTRGDLAGATKGRLKNVKSRLSDVGDRFSDVADRVNTVVGTGKEFMRQVQDTAELVKGHIKDLSRATQSGYRSHPVL